MNIEHISVSRGKSYHQCEYYYKLKYHDKIPNPGEEQFYFTYGKIIHKIAEMFVQEKGVRSLGDISNDVLRGKVPIEEGKEAIPAQGEKPEIPAVPPKFAPNLPADYKRRLPIHMRSVQKLTSSVGCEGLTEHKFKYDLDPPHGKMVTGFIDRIILKDDKAWIIDYKTTKKGPYRENEHTILNDPQLRLYSRVVQRDFGISAKNIKAALYYLEDSVLLGAQYTEESLLGIEKELLSVYNEIKEKKTEDAYGKTGQHCARCEYNLMCPFFQSKGSKAASWDGDFGSLGF